MSPLWSFPYIRSDICPYFFNLFIPSLCFFFTLVLSVGYDKSTQTCTQYHFHIKDFIPISDNWKKWEVFFISYLLYRKWLNLL